nr:DnaT-like ssDNA-binding protein [uncultured Duganella sp.]
MLINEAGTGLPNAESYASVAAADVRCAALGVTDWAPRTELEKEVALRRATQFMLANYRQRWAGRRAHQAQALDWPRYGVCVDGFPVRSDVVPAEVVNACIDLAVRSARGEELMPDLDRTISRETVGPITTVYESGASESPRFRAVDRMLEPYLCGSTLSGRLVRG